MPFLNVTLLVLLFEFALCASAAIAGSSEAPAPPAPQR
jgi:hypothetical protein